MKQDQNEPRIVGTIGHGPDRTFGPGDEEAFTAVATPDMIARLQRANPSPLAGDWQVAEADAPLPAVRELAAHLDTLTSADAVQAMADRDDRKSAAPLYEARLAALKGA